MNEEIKNLNLNNKLFFKNMCVYILHRSEEQDHEKGRPAILLKYKSETSLVWWGTHKKEKNADENPLILNINNTKGYYYSKGIEKVNNNDLKGRWINYKNNNIYELNNLEQIELITTFIQFTNQKNPYAIIDLLELENQILKLKIKSLKDEKNKLQQLLQYENEV